MRIKINKLDLLSKGWSVYEVEHASKIIEEAENKKHINIRFLDKSIYWALLVLLIIGNIVCAIFLIPFIFAIQSNFVIFIVGIVGFLFGTIFSILISDIKKTEHHANKPLLETLIVSGFINFALIIAFANDFSARSRLPLVHNPYVIATVYLVSFLIPHMVLVYTEYRESRGFSKRPWER